MVAMRDLSPAMAEIGGEPAMRIGGCAETRAYSASLGPRRGPLVYNEALLAMRVSRTWRGRGTMGTAVCVGRDEAGVALWELSIGTVELPGRWVVIDREFRRPESASGSG